MAFNTCMKIMPINISQQKQPAFQSCFRTYPSKTIKNFDIFGKDTVRTSTNLFREDLDWFGLVKFMDNHFKDKDKVNIFSLACSDGSESYTMAISILENLPENIKSKFLPIFASDIDKEVIKAAKTGRINILSIEFLLPERTYKCNVEKYFDNRSVSMMIDGDDISETDTIFSYQPIKELKDSAIFKHSDILTELNSLKDSGNSVILCRNVFPYIEESHKNEIVNSAKQNLKQGSLFVIGDYDGFTDVEQRLLANGFVQPLFDSRVEYSNNIFMRI